MACAYRRLPVCRPQSARSLLELSAPSHSEDTLVPPVVTDEYLPAGVPSGSPGDSSADAAAGFGIGSLAVVAGALLLLSTVPPQADHPFVPRRTRLRAGATPFVPLLLGCAGAPPVAPLHHSGEHEYVTAAGEGGGEA